MSLPDPIPRALPALVLVAGLAAAAPVQAQQAAYTVELVGAEQHDDLRAALREASRLFALREEPPPSPIGLRRRADADRERLAAALRSAGYYDGTLEIDVDTATDPAKVTIRVEAGPRYTIGEVAVEAVGDQPVPGAPFTAAEIGLTPGQPARAPQIVAAQDVILPMLAARGHAYNRLVDRQVVVDHADRTVDVTYLVAPGPKVTFGEITVSGLERVEMEEVRRRIPIEPGQVFSPEALAETRAALVDLGVFSSVRLQVADAPTAQDTAPVSITVEERDMRFIGFGVSFATEEGFGANAYWGHRNLFGGAERLRVSGEVAGIGRDDIADVGDFDYRFGTTYEEPDFYRAGQTLTLSLQALSERPEAYRRNAIILTGALERTLWEGVIGKLGVSIEQSRVDEGGIREGTTNTLLSIPATITADRTDDILNPTQGWRANAAVTPFLAAFGDSESFTVSRIGGSAYFDLSGGEGNYVAAGRALIGSIVGVGGLLDIPADKRFYAGGGGSIRGFGYQEVGPLDAVGDPLGGRSLIELGLEMRVKVTESIGVVPFIDGGNVYTSEYPDFEEDLRWGAGLGVRYYTGIGPIRVDVAVPLTKREGDADWQLYISIGQAF